MRPNYLQLSPSQSSLSYKSPPFVSIHPNHRDLVVSFGQSTFDCEGQEAQGEYFSRVIHWPGGNSGVTIGRGYDMGQRTRLQVISELKYAGVSSEDALYFAGGAGVRGERAKRYVESSLESSPALSLSAQRRLFETITTPEIISDIQRILSKPDLRAKYGNTSWEELTPLAREVVFDLRYRGDYTPETRTRVQPLLTAQDDRGLQALLNQRSYWQGLNVPLARINARIEMASKITEYRIAS